MKNIHFVADIFLVLLKQMRLSALNILTASSIEKSAISF
jgi:hypothetical protein